MPPIFSKTKTKKKKWWQIQNLFSGFLSFPFQIKFKYKISQHSKWTKFMFLFNSQLLLFSTFKKLTVIIFLFFRSTSSLLYRVCRYALPFQAGLLILLGVASIVPLVREEVICSVQNSFQESFEPMLHWSGTPPM